MLFRSIDGFTRDSAAVRSLGFPTFCRGKHMSDMLYHRQIVAINQPVVCGGVSVQPGDLVLGSEDGVVVVPADEVQGVIPEAIKKSGKENSVRMALRKGMSVSDAYQRFGVM